MAERFTRGSWEYRRVKGDIWEIGVVSEDYDQSFGMFIEHAEVNGKDNANLISTAPDLYDIVKRFYDAEDGNELCDAWTDMESKAREIINKLR